jgi:hypothetical protein
MVRHFHAFPHLLALLWGPIPLKKDTKRPPGRHQHVLLRFEEAFSGQALLPGSLSYRKPEKDETQTVDGCEILHQLVDS